jgi:aldose 1-epimerase
VLGYDTFESYPAHSPYFGAACGPVANRIKEGRFTIDGVTHELDRNQGGRHTLHSGKDNLGRRPWTIVARDRRSVTLATVSEDGDMGFPGRLIATCTYILAEPATLRVIFTATTDKATPINFAHHSYFNLDGSADILDQRLQVFADLRTVTDAELIPTGEIVSVVDTPWDFRSDRPIRFDTPDGPYKYDGNFVLKSVGALAHASTAWSPKSGVTLECWTTEPGLQFYDGAKIHSPEPGLGGALYGGRAGFCLEAQRFPDAVNNAHFLGGVTRPGEVYQQTTEYRFGRKS